LLILTPLLISRDYVFAREEIIETQAVIILLVIGYFFLRLYWIELAKNMKELEKLKKEKLDLEIKLLDAFKHIGVVNVQIQQIRSIFSDMKKYPESKKDFKYTLEFFADKVLSIIDVDWVILRIIDTRDEKILKEFFGKRGFSFANKSIKISNSDLLSGKRIEGALAISSQHDNFHARIFCVIPDIKISRDQKELILAIVAQLEMLFIIFSSKYYGGSSAK